MIYEVKQWFWHTFEATLLPLLAVVDSASNTSGELEDSWVAFFGLVGGDTVEPEICNCQRHNHIHITILFQNKNLVMT